MIGFLNYSHNLLINGLLNVKAGWGVCCFVEEEEGATLARGRRQGVPIRGQTNAQIFQKIILFKFTRSHEKCSLLRLLTQFEESHWLSVSMMQRTILNYLTSGKVIGLPTDTVYGLAADARSDQAVAEIYALKSRPSFNPLIIHVHDLQQAQLYGIFNEDAVQLALHFWAPSQTASALTIVVPYKKNSGISSLALAGLDTIALRAPNHPLALQILAEFGGPLAAPSANPSNYLSPTTADHVRAAFPGLPVLDGDSCPIGIESTIVWCKDDGVSLLRPGIVTEDSIRDFVSLVGSHVEEAVRSPGALKKHYAPKTPMAMNVTSPLPGDVYIGFGPNYPSAINLSETGDLKEAAANLFRHLHVADNLGKKRIAVSPIPSYGIGQAINDRLSRGVRLPSHA